MPGRIRGRGKRNRETAALDERTTIAPSRSSTTTREGPPLFSFRRKRANSWTRSRYFTPLYTSLVSLPVEILTRQRKLSGLEALGGLKFEIASEKQDCWARATPRSNVRKKSGDSWRLPSALLPRRRVVPLALDAHSVPQGRVGRFPYRSLRIGSRSFRVEISDRLRLREVDQTWMSGCRAPPFEVLQILRRSASGPIRITPRLTRVEVGEGPSKWNPGPAPPGRPASE